MVAQARNSATRLRMTSLLLLLRGLISTTSCMGCRAPSPSWPNKLQRRLMAQQNGRGALISKKACSDIVPASPAFITGPDRALRRFEAGKMGNSKFPRTGRHGSTCSTISGLMRANAPICGRGPVRRHPRRTLEAASVKTEISVSHQGWKGGMCAVKTGSRPGQCAGPPQRYPADRLQQARRPWRRAAESRPDDASGRPAKKISNGEVPCYGAHDSLLSRTEGQRKDPCIGHFQTGAPVDDFHVTQMSANYLGNAPGAKVIEGNRDAQPDRASSRNRIRATMSPADYKARVTIVDANRPWCGAMTRQLASLFDENGPKFPKAHGHPAAGAERTCAAQVFRCRQAAHQLWRTQDRLGGMLKTDHAAGGPRPQILGRGLSHNFCLLLGSDGRNGRDRCRPFHCVRHLRSSVAGHLSCFAACASQSLNPPLVMWATHRLPGDTGAEITRPRACSPTGRQGDIAGTDLGYPAGGGQTSPPFGLSPTSDLAASDETRKLCPPRSTLRAALWPRSPDGRLTRPAHHRGDRSAPPGSVRVTLGTNHPRLAPLLACTSKTRSSTRPYRGGTSRPAVSTRPGSRA